MQPCRLSGARQGERLAANVRRRSCPNFPEVAWWSNEAVVGDSSAGCTRIISKPSPSGSSSTACSWKDWFTNPFQWCDKEKSITHLKSPDFKQKITKDIHGWDNAGSVKDRLQKAGPGMHKAKAFSSQTHSRFEDCGFLDECGKASIRSGGKVNALRLQELQENRGLEMLRFEEVLTSLERMPWLPSIEDLTCILHKCRKMKNLRYAKQLYAYMCKSGLETHRSLGNYLVPILVEVGSLQDAQQVFNRLGNRNEITWTSLITGYIECGDSEHALILYQKMQEDHVRPTEYTFVPLLKACARLKDGERGRGIHAEIARKGLEIDIFLGSTLVDMYAKCGLLSKAQEEFDKLPVRNVVSWTALIAGYAERGLGEEALNCFERMQLEGISPDALTLVCSLKACGSIGAIDKGQEIHVDIARRGLLARNLIVGNALVDMYAKCGSLAKACEVFDKLPMRDVVSWTALIAGYAHLGESENVFHTFERMRGEGIKPDGVAYLSVLTVCCHTGLVDKAQSYFEAMSKEYGIIFTTEHHTCMVDLFGRAGQLDNAVAMMKKMPFHPNLAVWHSVLGACRSWGNVELGKCAFEHAVQLNEKDSAAYVLMSNIYADAYMEEGEKKAEVMRVKE